MKHALTTCAPRLAAWAQRGILACLAGMLLLVALAAPAGAAASPDSTVLDSGVCTSGSSAPATSSYLPVNRWADATTGFHSRLDADAWNDVSEKIQRVGMASLWMQLGNAMWSLSANLLHASTAFCPIKTLGQPMDQIVALIGGAITTSGLLIAILVWLIVVTLWQVRRGHGWSYVGREFLKTAAILGLMFSMITGAQASTATAPGSGGPWWWVAKVNSAVNTLSGSLTSAAMDNSAIKVGYQKLSDSTELDASEWTVRCTKVSGATGFNYLDYLHKTYTEAWTNPDSGTVTEGSELPATVSRLWEATALPVWAGTQFGTSNPYSDQVFCFALEAKSLDKTADKSTFYSYLVNQLDISRDEAKAIVANSHIFDDSSTVSRDNAWAGWAECAPVDATTASARSRWNELADRSADDGACVKWWSGGDISRSNLNWEDDEDKIASATGSDRASEENFLDSLHGKGGSNTSVPLILYVVGSAINAGVFIMIAAMQALSKIVLVFMIAGIFMALVRALAPGNDSELFKKSSKQLLGAAFVSSCAGLLISIILMIASVITKVAVGMFGAGSSGAIIAGCIGPALGAFFLHWLFTSVLSLPSPFTVKGMAAWGRGITSGVIGGAVGAGLVTAASGLVSRGARGSRDASRKLWDRKHPKTDASSTERGKNASDEGESATQQVQREAQKKEGKHADTTVADGERGKRDKTQSKAERLRDAGRRLKAAFPGQSGSRPAPKGGQGGTGGAHRAPLSTRAGITAAAKNAKAWASYRRTQASTAAVARASQAIDRAKTVGGSVGNWTRRTGAPALGVLAMGAVAGAPAAAGAAAAVAGHRFVQRVHDYRNEQEESAPSAVPAAADTSDVSSASEEGSEDTSGISGETPAPGTEAAPVPEAKALRSYEPAPVPRQAPVRRSVFDDTAKADAYAARRLAAVRRTVNG